mmetsp:Transcript_17177/g.39935  ORF Transcript_17177/g.39935 Transcript_17177/m.39935 type:complete len:218 (-) Transcript_17177:65-718(-)
MTISFRMCDFIVFLAFFFLSSTLSSSPELSPSDISSISLSLKSDPSMSSSHSRLGFFLVKTGLYFRSEEPSCFLDFAGFCLSLLAGFFFFTVGKSSERELSPPPKRPIAARAASSRADSLSISCIAALPSLVRWSINLSPLYRFLPLAFPGCCFSGVPSSSSNDIDTFKSLGLELAAALLFFSGLRGEDDTMHMAFSRSPPALLSAAEASSGDSHGN